MSQLVFIPDNAISKNCEFCGKVIYLLQDEFDNFKPFEEHPDRPGKAVPHITHWIGTKRYCRPLKKQGVKTPLFG